MSNIPLIFVSETVAAAMAVINGYYGVGDERKQKLEEAGYDYDTIQSCVNELLPVVQKYE